MFSSFIAFNNKDFAMKRLLVLFFAVLPYFSFAACWESIYFDDNLKDNVFIDLCGISGKDIKTFWVKYTFSKEKDIERNGKKMNKSMSFHSIDCINSKISTKSINYYLNDEYSHSAKWDMESYENIVPETVGEKIKDSVCNIDSFKEKVDFFSLTKETPCFSKEKYQTDTKAISYDECITPKKYMGLIKIITSTRIKADEALKIFG